MHYNQAKKKFGQNFLVDQTIINKIIKNIDPKKEENIIEIGPGLGAITIPLSKEITLLNIIEIDKDLVNNLLKSEYANKLNIFSTDVLQFDFNEIKGKKKIIGNLPYNISTKILINFTSYTKDIESMFFMLQKEVANRISAKINNKNYGRLSVLLQYHFHIENLFDVLPECFRPIPKVISSFVKMVPIKEEQKIPIFDYNCFTNTIKESFKMKRKTIHNNLKHIINKEELINLEIDPKFRPENIEVNKYVNLSNYIAKRN